MNKFELDLPRELLHYIRIYNVLLFWKALSHVAERLSYRARKLARKLESLYVYCDNKYWDFEVRERNRRHTR